MSFLSREKKGFFSTGCCQNIWSFSLSDLLISVLGVPEEILAVNHFWGWALSRGGVWSWVKSKMEMQKYLSFEDVNAGLILTVFAKTKYAPEYMQYCHDACFPSLISEHGSMISIFIHDRYEHWSSWSIIRSVQSMNYNSCLWSRTDHVRTLWSKTWTVRTVGMDMWS